MGERIPSSVQPVGLVCVIDDNAIVRKAVCDILGTAGIPTVQACDGEEGLLLVAERKPAVVVTDIVMPNHEGIETIQDLKKTHPDVRIIAMSGSQSAGDFLKLAGYLGADDCLVKPFQPGELLRKVWAQLGKQRS